MQPVLRPVQNVNSTEIFKQVTKLKLVGLQKVNRFIAFLVFVLFAMNGSVNAQISNYAFTPSSGTFTPLTTGTILGTNTNDDQVFIINTTGSSGTTSGTGFSIGFSFTYNGVAYDRFAVSTNGFIVVGTNTFSITGGNGFSTPLTTGSANSISAFSDDLQGQTTTSGGTRTSGSNSLTGITAGRAATGMTVTGTGIPAGAFVTAVSGTTVTISANATSTSSSSTYTFGSTLQYANVGSTLVVQWAGYREFGASGELMNFQVILTQTTSTVQLVYGIMTASAAYTVQVGLSGATNADFNDRTSNTSWSTTSAGGSGATMTLSSTVKPVSGQTYTFTPPPTIATNAGNNQTATAGSPVSILPSVILKNGAGAPVAGVTVTFAITSGGGSISGASAITNGSGIATVGSWTLGTTAGTNTLTASATGYMGSPVTFTATGTAGTATKLSVTSQPTTGTSATALSPSLVITIQDANGNTVTSSSATVGITIASGTGTLSGTTSVNAASGVATFSNLRLDKATTYTLTAASAGLTSATTGNIVIAPGAASKLSVTSQPTTGTSAIALSPSLVITVQDASGNTVTGSSAAVSITIATGTGTLSGTTSVNATSGVATFSNLKLDKATTYTLTAASSGLSSATTGNIVISVGAASKYLVTSSSYSPIAGSFVTITAQLADAGGNTISTSGNVITWTNTGSGGSFSSPTSTTDASGIATVTFTTGTTVGSYTVTATDAASLTGTSATITSVAGNATKLSVTSQPTTGTSATALSPSLVITIQDANGNTVTSSSATVGITIASGTGTLSGTTSVNAASGVATFSNLRLDKATTYTLTAASAGLTSATTGNIVIAPGAASKLSVTSQPTTGTSAIALSPSLVITVQDASGNTVTGSSAAVSITIATGTGTLSGTTSVNAASGVATFSNLKLDKATTYTLTAASSGLSSAATGNIVISAGTATKLGITTQPTAPSVNGSTLAIQPVIVVQDAAGNTITSSAASITATPTGNGTWRLGGGTNPVTAVNGTATYSGLTASSDDQVSAASLTFSSAGLTSVTSSTFNIAAPTYLTQWISMNTGSSNWCQGETRNITVTVKNIGTATWSNSTVTMNVGAKWDEDADYGNTIPRVSIESGSPAGTVAPGATVTYTFPNVPASTLQGGNHLTFDIVREAKCWFADPISPCNSSNSRFVSSSIGISANPTISSVTATPSTICNGGSSNLLVTLPTATPITIVNYDFNIGTSFGTLNPALATNISSVASGSTTFATASGTTSGSQAFTANITAEEALSAARNNSWTFTLTGSALQNYNTFKVYLQGQRTGSSGSITVTYSVNGGAFTGTGVSPASLTLGTSFTQQIFTLPAGADNATTSLAINIAQTGSAGSNTRLDNFQIQGVPENSFAWSPITGLNSSTIANPVASPTATTTYTVNVTSPSGCQAASSSVTITVNQKSVNPTSATATSTTICIGSSTILTLNGGGGGTGEVIKWYTGSCGGTAAGTGNNLSVSPTVTTTYYGRYEDGAPCNYNSLCAQVTITVNQKSTNPTSATASSTSICTGTPVTLTLNGGGGGMGTVLHWYSGSCGGTLAGTGNNLSVSPTTTTTYYGRYEDGAPCSFNTNCASVTITVSDPSIAPTSATASSTFICNGTPVTLTLNGGGGGTGEVIKWYAGSCGGTAVGTGNNFSVSPTTTTTYYGRYEDGAPCSFNTACASVTVTVNQQSTGPTSATASFTSICSGGSTVLTLNGGGGGTGEVIHWYSGSCGSTAEGTGNNLSVSPTVTTTYYGRFEDGGPCSFNTACASVTITVTTQPAATISYDGSPYCSNAGSATVTFSGTPGGNYTSSPGGLSLNSSNGTIDLGASTSGTYTITYTVAASGACTIYTTTATITIDLNTWKGLSSVWNDDNNWTCRIPTATSDITIPNVGTSPVISTSQTVRNITIASGASVTTTATGILTISGIYSNSGTLANDGTLILNGTAQQTFPGANATVTAMNVLEVNNINGVTIDKSFTLSGVLTPTAGMINLGDNFITLKSDVNNTARIGVVGGGFNYNNGRFIVERYFNSTRSWRLMTAPVKESNTIFDGWQLGGLTTTTTPAVAGQGEYVTGPGATGVNGNGLDAGVSGNYSLKTYNSSTGALAGVGNTKVSVSPGYPGSNASNIGYFNFVRGDRTPSNIDPNTTNTNITTLSSTGKLQTGSYTFPAVPIQNKYTLIGNPYASPVYFPSVTLNNVARRFYAWDPQINQVGAYVIVDDEDGDNVWSYSVDTFDTPQRLDIQSGQAIYVQTIADGTVPSTSLIFDETNKSGRDVGMLFRPAGPSSAAAAALSFRTSLYLLNADNSTHVADGIFAEFSTDFSNAVDVQDGVKFPNVNETFSLVRNGVLLGLERRQPISATDTLFFNLTKSSQRGYQFGFTAEGLYQAGIEAFLEDSYLKTSTSINLSARSTVNFTITSDAASAVANRFRVVFKPSAGGPLPVTFTSVKAYQQNSAINVSWKVENEMNIKEYQVEKSTDGIHFGNAVTIKATGNNGSTANYQWPDADPVAGNNYYRITSVDINGKAEHSNIVKVFMGRGKAGLMVYPNPVVDGNINLQLVNQPGGRYSIRLLNKLGQEIMAKQIEHEEGSSTQTLKISKTIAHGTYQLEITKPDHSKSIINVLK